MDEPLAMGGESSSPDPPVSPSVSELRLVLLGRTGAGRRAAGNTILGREEFGAQDSPSAVTQRSRRREGDVCGRRLVLVDTPDWFCPGLSLEEMRQDVGLCVRLSAPGPHAFLLVVPVEPSEGEERGAMERMEDMFGEGCWGHTVILFTHDDSLREQSMEEFLQTGSQDLQQLVEKCGNRYHVLNMKDRAHGTQVPALLHQVEEMVAGNRESFYSSQTYQGAEAQVREMEGKIQREREEKIQREETERKEKFETELQNSLKKIEGVIQEHEGDIRTLSHRTSELERQRSIMISHTKMQRDFSRQIQGKDKLMQEKNREMQEKDREINEKARKIENLTQRLMELSALKNRTQGLGVPQSTSEHTVVWCGQLPLNPAATRKGGESATPTPAAKAPGFNSFPIGWSNQIVLIQNMTNPGLKRRSDNRQQRKYLITGALRSCKK
ncbi:GTPase IMAP family member 9-like [Osmerus mordax]|uniref:GTPase IMAP family member 9-like n=1 Tax=Osmerus mordax TaxID=8014 RepID=UPI00350EC745